PTQDKGGENEMNTQLTELIELMKVQASSNPYEDAIVQAIIEKGKNVSTDQLLESAREKLDNYIQETYGALPKQIEIKTEQATKKITGILHKKFETILKFVGANVP